MAAIGYAAAQRGDAVAIAGTLALRAIYALFRVAPRRIIGKVLSKKRRSMAIYPYIAGNRTSPLIFLR